MNSTKKNVTVRKQKIRKNHIRGKLLFFSALVVILLIAAALARQKNYVPMIHMHRISFRRRNHPVQNILWEQTVMDEICFREYWSEVRPVFMQRLFW